MKLRTFRVFGSGDFPLDMLRYDSCWPATEADSAWAAEADCPRRSVTLETPATSSAPTIGRWESFGWKVVVA